MMTAAPSDADLVRNSLADGAGAFSEIVRRYQNLICSLTYNATGSLSRSEDLAQEVFVVAWKELRSLREPAKLRSWLCGIARRLSANLMRREGREPVSAAEELDAEHHSSTPDPSEQAISREEEAILWRSLDQIPEVYREPLILFYREDQSVERVAQALELTEDAARQRLSRGRRMLQEQVALFVEGALRQSTPGRAFTLGVVAALPLMTTSATAATLGSTAAKGGAAAKAAGLLGILSVAAGPIVGCLGAWFGVKASIASAQSERERQSLRRQVRRMIPLVIGSFVAFAGTSLLANRFWNSHPTLATLLVVGVPVAYVVILLALILRGNRELRRIREEEQPDVDPETAARHARAWKTIEYRSRWTFLGVPLVHVRSGRPRGEKLQPAVGWIAVGDVAIGVLFAGGGITFGGISMGGVSLGALALGGVAAGGITYGGFAIGLWAVGGLAIGQVAMGGSALAWHAAEGGFAMAHEFALGGRALAAHANDEAAKAAIDSSGFFRMAEFTMRWAPAIAWTPLLLVLWQARRALRIMRGKSRP